MMRKKSSGGSRVIEIGGAKEAPSRAGWLPPDAKGPRAPRFFFATRGRTLEWYLTAHGATPAGTLDLRDIRGMTPTDAAVLELKFDRPSAGGATSTLLSCIGGSIMSVPFSAARLTTGTATTPTSRSPPT